MVTSERQMVTSALRDEIAVPKGSLIFRQGDPGDEMFVISQGRVQLTIGTEGFEREVGVLGAGDFFGELSLLSDAPRTATAQALEDSTLLAIGRDVFAMMVQDDLDIVFRMMNIQGQRLSRADQPIRDLIRRLGHIRVAAHCLRRLWAPNTLWPVTLEVAEITAELGLSAQAVMAAAADLVQQGVGSLQDRRWNIPDREQAAKLLDAVCRYAAQ
jgi:CRP/FNR family cyclic AMP-dependent transcriptional regulator